MAAGKEREELETCPICPASGPPVPPNSSEQRSEDDEELQWIACSKCKKWYHCVCTILVPEYKETVPAELRQELEASGQGEWFDWADRVDRW
jgi:F-box/leucine-rich repeat protein 10/11